MSDLNNEKWVFILNPSAGKGAALKLLPELKQRIKVQKPNSEIVFTKGKKHATKLAQDYIEKGFTHIIGVGGDGTLNEIASSVSKHLGIVMGVVAAGSGNDFAPVVGFTEKNTESDWEALFAAKTQQMDIGVCNQIVFINGMGIGFDAEITSKNYTKDMKVKMGGKRKYIWHILTTLLFFKEKKMRVHQNGDSYLTDCFINTIAIGRRFGGGFYLTPKAIANDGLFDVLMVKRINLLQRINILPKVPKGTHLGKSYVNYYNTTDLQLEFDNEVAFHADGELYFAKKFNVFIKPNALTVIYKPNSTHYFNV